MMMMRRAFTAEYRLQQQQQQQHDDDGALLRWAACTAWACLIGATHVASAPARPAPRPAAHAAAALLALAILTSAARGACCQCSCGDSYRSYLPYAVRAAVYLALSLVDCHHGGPENASGGRIAMLRYGAVLFAPSAPLLAVTTTVLGAAVLTRLQLVRNPSSYYYHRLLRAARKGQLGCGGVALLLALGHSAAETGDAAILPADAEAAGSAEALQQQPIKCI